MKKIMIFIEIIICASLLACSKSNPRVAVEEKDIPQKTIERIKELYCNIDNRKHGGLTKEYLSIRYYFGNYGKDKDAYVVIIKNHAKVISIADSGYYEVDVWNSRKEGYQTFKFVTWPGEIEVVCEDEIYSLSVAAIKEILNLEDIENIYNKFIKIDEVKKYYE